MSQDVGVFPERFCSRWSVQCGGVSDALGYLRMLELCEYNGYLTY